MLLPQVSDFEQYQIIVFFNIKVSDYASPGSRLRFLCLFLSLVGDTTSFGIVDVGRVTSSSLSESSSSSSVMSALFSCHTLACSFFYVAQN